MSTFMMGVSAFDKFGTTLGGMDLLNGNVSQPSPRGYGIYSYSQLMGMSGKNKDGDIQHVEYQVPTFALDPYTRIEIFKLCAPVFGVVTSRMNRISALEYSVIPQAKEEDKIVQRLKYLKSLYSEYPVDSFYALGLRLECVREIREYLPEVLPDLSNFDRALYRWHKLIKNSKQDVADQISDWLQQPNQDQEWVDFIKAWVFDLMVHGASALYKEVLDNKVENIYVLPGGSVYPVQEERVGGVSAYIQTMMTLDPIILYQDEIVYSSYIPSSASKYGFVPLDALVNKIAESLLFDKLMADQADGTRPPEKILIFGEATQFGDFKGMDNFTMPLRKEEQQRIEHVVNEARMGAVRVLSGYGQPFTLDLTRENTMSTQMQRQETILKDIALVFNMSNMEVNLSGGDGTSGRNTSEAQAEIENAKGTRPITKLIESRLNKQVLPFRFGSGYKLEFITEQSEQEEYQTIASKLQTGIFTVNEIRIEKGLDPFDDEQFDKPPNAQPKQEDQPQQEPPPEAQPTDDPLAGLFG
jgi:phage portal protein BeeE